jgi:hypothetical protein
VAGKEKAPGCEAEGLIIIGDRQGRLSINFAVP